MSSYSNLKRNRYINFFLNVVVIYGKSPSLKKFLELTLTLGTTAILSVFAVKPTALTVIGLVNEINSKKEMIALMDKKIGNLRTAQNIFYSQTQLLNNLDTALPEDPDPGIFLKQIEGAALASGASITDVEVGKAIIEGGEKEKPKTASSETGVFKLPDGISTLTSTISFSGSFSNLRNLISILDNMRRPLILDKIDIVKSRTQDLTVTALISAPYFQKNK